MHGLQTREYHECMWFKSVSFVWTRFDIILIMFEVSASELKPAAVVTPLQSRSQGSNEKPERNVEEEQSIAITSKCEAVSFESRQEHSTGVLKGTQLFGESD